MKYKHFTETSPGVFTYNGQKIRNIILAAVCFYFAYYSIHYSLLSLVIFAGLGAYMIAAMLILKVRIDTNKNIVSYRKNILSPEEEVSIDNFNTTEIYSRSLWGIIPFRTILYAYFDRDNSYVVITVGNAFTAGTLQVVSYEMRRILGADLNPEYSESEE